MKIVTLTSSMAPTLAILHERAFSSSEVWSPTAIAESLGNAANCGFGVYDDGQVHSYLIVQRIDEEVEILTIATEPEARRQGHARRLLAHIQQLFSPNKIMLEVAQDNPGAIAFYEQMGFAKDGYRPDYYRRLDGARIDAILMSKRLAGQTHR